MNMTRMMSVSIAAASAALMLSLTAGAAGPACDPDNGGLKLPQGFCAAVVAENVGPARHLAPRHYQGLTVTYPARRVTYQLSDELLIQTAPYHRLTELKPTKGEVP